MKKVIQIISLSTMITMVPNLALASDKPSPTAEVTKQAAGFVQMALAPKLNNPVVSMPEDYGLDYEEVNFKTPDGITLSA